MPQSIDEAEIRDAVRRSRWEPTIVVEDRTPGGKPRQFPVYRVEVRNVYLGTTKTFKAKDLYYAQNLACNQLDAWAETEFKKRCAAAKTELIVARSKVLKTLPKLQSRNSMRYEIS
jgi:hypothetical protein